jgi:hypothetical protein
MKFVITYTYYGGKHLIFPYEDKPFKNQVIIFKHELH